MPSSALSRTLMWSRRGLLALAFSGALVACTHQPAAQPGPAAQPPIVFVHGNGDTAALWTTTLWRWESNGWPRERLHAVHLPYPQARADDTQVQAGRSSVTEQMQVLAAEVDRVLASTGADKVVLVGNSRGGNVIRHFIANGGGAAKVSHAILGGTPNHGVWSNPGFQPNSEFNGAGAFLKGLNAPKGPNGDEVTPGVAWMTLRSDNNDKFAQPDGVWIGAKGTPTNVTFDGPALKGATNRVMPGRDHREVSYHPEAFAHSYQFVTGQAPRVAGPLHITPESQVTLSGQVSGFTAAGPTNLPLPGAQLTVWAVDASTGARQGTALLSQTIDEQGRWGPVRTDSRTPLEFELSAPGFAVTHFYRSAFQRSSSIVNLRPERLSEAERQAGAVVSFTRPRGYFGVPRDTILIDGQAAPGIAPSVAGVAVSRSTLSAGTARPVVGEYRSGSLSQRIVGQVWPARDNHLTVLELHE